MMYRPRRWWRMTLVPAHTARRHSGSGALSSRLHNQGADYAKNWNRRFAKRFTKQSSPDRQTPARKAETDVKATSQHIAAEETLINLTAWEGLAIAGPFLIPGHNHVAKREGSRLDPASSLQSGAVVRVSSVCQPLEMLFYFRQNPADPVIADLYPFRELPSAFQSAYVLP